MNNRLLKIILVYFGCTIIFSCHPYSSIDIVNLSDKNVDVEIKYGKDFNSDYLYSVENREGGKLIRFDSVSRTTVMRLEINEVLGLYFKKSDEEPDLDFIEKLTIFGQDTLIFDTSDEIEKAFKKNGVRSLILEIKR